MYPSRGTTIIVLILIKGLKVYWCTTRTEFIHVQECIFLDPDIFYLEGVAHPMEVKNIRVQKNAFLDMKKIGPGQGS